MIYPKKTQTNSRIVQGERPGVRVRRVGGKEQEEQLEHKRIKGVVDMVVEYELDNILGSVQIG